MVALITIKKPDGSIEKISLDEFRRRQKKPASAPSAFAKATADKSELRRGKPAPVKLAVSTAQPAKNEEAKSLLEEELPPKTDNAPLKSAEFIVSFADGLAFIQSDQVDSIRQVAKEVKGYAVVLSASQPRQGVWGHKPDAFDLMGALKARWDPRGILNQGAFAV